MISPAAKAPAHQPVRGRADRFWLTAALGIAVATVANLGLYALGRGMGAALRIDPGAGAPNHLIVPGDVAWKTAVPLTLGTAALVLLARRSRRWATALILLGVAVVAASIPFVLAGAHDTTTGVLLSSMHIIAGLAFLVIGSRARGAWADRPRAHAPEG